MTNTDIRKVTSEAPYEYIQEYQSIEQEFKSAPSSRYKDIYDKIQNLETRVSLDLKALSDFEASSASNQTLYKKVTTDYSEIYKSIYAKILLVGISMIIVAGYGIYYIWSVFSAVPATASRTR
jgi:hypothetical protein